MSLPNHLFEQLLPICRTPENGALLIEAIETGGGDLTLTTSNLVVNGEFGANGTFTSQDGKTITLTAGLITSIV